MEPNNEFDFHAAYNDIYNMMLNDPTADELARLVQQRQQQSANTARPRRRRSVVERGREEGHTQLVKDYFSENPVYTDTQFRRRFHMRKHVFLRIVETLGNHDEYFQMSTDVTGRSSLSPLQKCTAAIRMLAYETPANFMDEYIRIGETTINLCLEKFIKGVTEVFGPHYMRRPNNEDTVRLLQMGESRGFSGMLGSIDCMRWEWKNCPVAWKGQYCRGDHGKPTVMLEAMASQDLWIWHAFFGIAGSNNDINVLHQSDLFTNVLNGEAPAVQYTVNGTSYDMGYYLADGIYPTWATFVKTIPMPQGSKRQLFAQKQEGARKDVERAFGVLQSRFAIICGPSRNWHVDTMRNIMYACIIMHNMIVEDERDGYNGNFDYEQVNNNSNAQVFNGPLPHFITLLERITHVRETQIHHQLQHDLIEHIWQRFGDEADEVYII